MQTYSSVVIYVYNKQIELGIKVVSLKCIVASAVYENVYVKTRI